MEVVTTCGTISLFVSLSLIFHIFSIGSCLDVVYWNRTIIYPMIMMALLLQVVKKRLGLHTNEK